MSDTVTVPKRPESAASERKTPRRGRRRPGRIIVPVVILAVLATAGYYTWRYLNTYESTDDAQIDGHINPISARISGQVLQVLTEDERYVKAGDVLVRIDPKDYEVAVAKAEADLSSAEATLLSSRTNVPVTDISTSSQLLTARSGRVEADAALIGARRQLDAATARLESARAQVREAEANEQKARDDEARYKLLVVKDEISRQQYDTAVSAEAAAKATVDTRRAAVAEAEQNINVAQSAVEQAQTKIVQADAFIQGGDDGAAASRDQPGACQVLSGASRGDESGARSGETQSQLLHHRRSG